MNPEFIKIRQALDRLCVAAISLSGVVGVVAIELFVGLLR